MMELKTLPLKVASATITAVDSTVLEIANTGGRRLLDVTIKNTGATAFSTARVQRRSHPDGAWVDWIGASDFAGNIPIFCSTQTPANLPAGASANLVLDLAGASGVRILASVLAGSTTASVDGSLTE